MIIELTQQEITAAIAEYVGNQMMRRQNVPGYTVVAPKGQEGSQKVTVNLVYDSSKNDDSRVTAKVELL